MNAHIANKDLGTDEELSELVARIRGFDFDNATPKENLALARALKVVAEDTVRRNTIAREMQEELRKKLSLAEVTSELSEVIQTMRPKRRWFWGKALPAWRQY